MLFHIARSARVSKTFKNLAFYMQSHSFGILEMKSVYFETQGGHTHEGRMWPTNGQLAAVL